MMTRRILAVTAFAGVLALGACADMMADSKTHMTANLTGAAEVPPVRTTGNGVARVAFDKGSKMLTWEVDYRGLSGPVTAAHFHGPAAAGANAGVALGMTASASPMTGSATLTDAQAQQVLAGMWYINIHTAGNPAGEIRGQVVHK